MKNCAPLFSLISAGMLLSSPDVKAAPTTISSNTTAAQTVTSSNTPFTVNQGVTVNVGSGGSTPSGNGTVAVTVTGNSTINNNGTIEELDTASASAQNGRAIRLNTANVTLTINNNATGLIKSGDADAIQVNKASDSATLNNYGTITSLNYSGGGAQAVDFNAISSGSNTINNYAGGVLQASEADAVRPGVNGVVNNSGKIYSTTTTNSSSDGIDAQTNTGISITNAASTTGTGGLNLIEGARHGISGGVTDTTGSGAFTMSITNNLGGTIKGDNGSGVNIDGFNANEVVTILNAGTITGDGVTRDGDGVDVDGLVKLTNTGTIQSLNSYEDVSEGVTVGGGTITNSGTIEGSVTPAGAAGGSVGRGITLAGVDKNSSGTTIPTQKIYANTTITNNSGGLIKGDSDSGITVAGTSGATNYTVSINNNANATIQGGGATVAAIEAAGTVNNDTIVDYGLIEDSASNKAIDFGDGTNSLQIMGGAASIIGNIAGGSGANSLSIDPGAGNSFGYAGVISNFSSVQTKSGTVTFTGANTYAGATTVSGGTTYVNNATGSGTGAGAVSVSRQATLGGDGIIKPGSGNGVSLAAQANLISGGVQTGTTAGRGLTLDNTVAKGTILDASISTANLTYYLGADGSCSSMTILGNTANELKFATGDTITLDDLTNGKLTYSSPYLLISTTAGNNSDYSGLITTGGVANGVTQNGAVLNLALIQTGATGPQTTELYLRNGKLELQSIPEPGTGWLVLLGGMGLAAFSRLRRIL